MTAVVIRRLSLAWRAFARSIRYASANATDLGWRDAVALPVVVVGVVLLALLAPDALSEDSFLDRTPHGPPEVK